MKAKVLDLYTDLVRIQGLMPDNDYTIKNSVDTLRQSVNSDEISDISLKTYYEGLSVGIYGLADKLRSIVDDIKPHSKTTPDIVTIAEAFEKGEPIKDANYYTNGISNSSKLKIMLLGETSAGKTTFLERIFGGEKCGETGPIPITAFAVIHKSEDLQTPFLEIKFKYEFTIREEKRAEFDKFLKEHEEFVSCFTNSIKGSYLCKNNSHKLYGSDKSDSFVKQANKYYEAFEEIVWHHKKSSKFCTITDFAEFYDMPGSGGMEEHTDNLNSALSKYNADIVLYLLKSDQGVSSKYEYLKQLKEYTEKRTLFFIYQIKNNDPFDKKIEALREFICKDDTSDAIDPFDDIERRYFSKIPIVDARGGKEDKYMADIALATILQYFYVKRSESFYSTLKSPTEDPKEYRILEPRQGKDGVNMHLRDFLEEINNACNSKDGLPLLDTIIKKFDNRFCLEEKPESDKDDLMTTLKTTYKTISDLKWDVIKTCCSRKTILSDYRFNPTMYINDFNEEYKGNEDYKQLIYLIQAYHFLRLSYQGTLKQMFERKIVGPIFDRLEEYINRLKSIENHISVVRTINDGEDY